MKLKKIAFALVAVGLASAAQAQIVNVDVTPFSGINGGATPGNKVTYNIGPFAVADFTSQYFTYALTGIDGDSSLKLSVYSTSAYANPRNFALGSLIDGTASWSDSDDRTAFKDVGHGVTAPDWLAGSYMGFRAHNGSGQYNYGWLEVLWDSSSEQFQVLSGAYESTLDLGIQAGATASTTGGGGAVPEPGEWAAMGVLGAGLTGLVLRKRRKV